MSKPRTIAALPPQLFVTHGLRNLEADLSVSVRRGAPKAELLAPVANDWIKPKGGLWTSTYENGTAGWVEWCRAESYGSPDTAAWWLLTPRQGLKLLEIDSVEDLIAIREAFPRKEHLGTPSEKPFRERSLNFEAMARDGYDGMHLTDEGQCRTRFAIDLYGWDCESTCWFRWAFEGEPQLLKPAKKVSA